MGGEGRAKRDAMQGDGHRHQQHLLGLLALTGFHYPVQQTQFRRRRLPERGHWRPQLGEQVLLTRADGSEVVGVVEMVGLGGIQARIEGIGLVKVGWEIVAPAQKRVG